MAVWLGNDGGGYTHVGPYAYRLLILQRKLRLLHLLAWVPERSVTIVHQLRASVRKRGDDAGERRFVGGDELYRDHVCVNRLEPIYRLVMHTKKCG
ncbi:hypothetical protein PF007_g28458 [Phytophthora fragariae]|uniref:Uncharacterized protein n=1 Tax=Phytophthora fragariae TaxID=53985 RepID=A0A6A3Q0L6_9STRA|nr:hypothetical protein PF009_g28856 [Phytophthora fragariae]KAE9066465.1 hypothetical protein PF007_g28458 [Phytophthora fragariae]